LQLNGIFIVADLNAVVAEKISEINRRFDPKLAASRQPHVTITGSSGAGPIPPTVDVAVLEKYLRPIAASTAPMKLRFGKPQRFLQSEIVVLPLDPHGALRRLHDRIVSSGIPFTRARFTFTPHCTLSLYPTLTPEAARHLLSVRIDDEVILDRIDVYHTNDPQPARKLLELPLTGEAAGD
jgi:2'-5' RNA ligase